MPPQDSEPGSQAWDLVVSSRQNLASKPQGLTTKLRHIGTTKISQKFGGFPDTVGKTSEYVSFSLFSPS